MFTGLIEEIGTVVAVTPVADSATLTVAVSRAAEGTGHGDSICINGVCLTVTEMTASTLSFDVMKESLDRSSLGQLTVGSPVNVERATAVGDRLGGHIVQGHVDGTGTVLSRTHTEQWDVVRIGVPTRLAPFFAEKGSIAIDGVSLTISAVSPLSQAAGKDNYVEVSLIPTTLAETTLGGVAVGDTVNLETDVVAKYVARLTESYGEVDR